MFENMITNYEPRLSGAFEIEASARKRSREMAMLAREFQSQKETESKKRSGLLRALIASLFLS